MPKIRPDPEEALKFYVEMSRENARVISIQNETIGKIIAFTKHQQESIQEMISYIELLESQIILCQESITDILRILAAMSGETRLPARSMIQ